MFGKPWNRPALYVCLANHWATPPGTNCSHMREHITAITVMVIMNNIVTASMMTVNIIITTAMLATDDCLTMIKLLLNYECTTTRLLVN